MKRTITFGLNQPHRVNVKLGMIKFISDEDGINHSSSISPCFFKKSKTRNLNSSLGSINSSPASLKCNVCVEL